MESIKNTFSKACYECGLVIEGPSKEQFNRTMGMHQRNTHGKRGEKTDWWSLQINKQNEVSLNKRWRDMSKEERREYHRRWWKKNKGKRKQTVKPAPEEVHSTLKKTTNAIPIALEYCPCCKARFYATQTNDN